MLREKGAVLIACPSFYRAKRIPHLWHFTMVVFPNCKINLGLSVTRKREDGYHDLLTCFYPLNWCDALEVTVPANSSAAFEFTTSGLPIAGNIEDNLIYKCWKAIKTNYVLPPLHVHLHKVIPMGAGLGGGSSDAAFFINLLDKKFDLSIPHPEKLKLAASIGSDCPFFIRNSPALARGRGEILEDYPLDLSAYYVLCVFPNIHSNTSKAFAAIKPKAPDVDLADALHQPVETWKDTIVNDFEGPVFSQFPILKDLKNAFYESGAIYAAMSGSGSAVFGIFRSAPDLRIAQNYLYFLQAPATKAL